MKKLLFCTFAICMLNCSSYDELPGSLLHTGDMDAAETDPFSLENMRCAVSCVSGEAATELEPTHLYLRFSPASEQEFDTLLELKEIDCFNIPLDAGSAEACPSGDLYALVPVTVKLPAGIAYEVLKEYFDPSATVEGRSDPAWSEQVKAQARMLAQSAILDPGLKPIALPWLPSGQISVWDDCVGNYVPVRGVRVTIVNPADMLNKVTVKTDANGKFTSTKTVPAGAKVNYLISWENTGWVIKSSRTTLAGTSAVNRTGSWTLKIKNHPSLAHATIFRAAYRYWYKMPSYGLTPPDFGRQIRIVNYDAAPENYAGMFHSAPDFNANEPDIEIAGRQSGTARLFATTAHELGHAAHFSYNQSYFHKVNSFIKESWARFAEYLITDAEYRDLGADLHATAVIGGISYETPDNYNYQNWYADNNITVNSTYSPVFIDLYDDFNQHRWYSSIRPVAWMTPLLEWVPDDDICIPNAREVQEIAFGSKNSREAGGWIIQYAARYGISNDVIDRYWRVYAMIRE